MSVAIYRKYRPQKFSDVIGQNHIVQTLTNAIKNKHLGHAYLFTGPRGTGKTTLARLFAKTINCSDVKNSEPCLKCENCQNIQNSKSLDIIEIDAASNTGVDNIRELRETIKLPPTRAKYKVYIIDEVHMLSSGAFNALLKTLEEPPSHVIFILATTEIHKVPETILSRCQRFDFFRISLENIIKKLNSITKNEKIKIEKDALEMIAVASEGGMRDAESLLAQIIALEDKNITAKEVQEILGTTSHQDIEKMAILLLKRNTAEAILLIGKLSDEGYDLEAFGKSLLNFLRKLLVLSVDEKIYQNLTLELTEEQIKKSQEIAKNKTSEILEMLEVFGEIQNKIRSSFIPQLPLEMAIVKLGNKNFQAPVSNPEETKKDNRLPDREFHQKKEKTEEKNEKESFQNSEIISANEEEKFTENNSLVEEEDVKEKWNEVIKETKPFNHSLSAFLQNCQPVKIENGHLLIATKYSFYKDKLNETSNKLTIEKVLAKILGSTIRAKFVSEDEAGIKINPLKHPSEQNSGKSFNGVKDSSFSAKTRETDSLLKDAMEMMGGRLIDDLPERQEKY
jgi:DNA polymerase-3 subunit gamma/tau